MAPCSEWQVNTEIAVEKYSSVTEDGKARGFATGQAVSVALQRGASAAVFAPAWVYETRTGESFDAAQERERNGEEVGGGEGVVGRGRWGLCRDGDDLFSLLLPPRPCPFSFPPPGYGSAFARPSTRAAPTPLLATTARRARGWGTGVQERGIEKGEQAGGRMSVAGEGGERGAVCAGAVAGECSVECGGEEVRGGFSVVTSFDQACAPMLACAHLRIAPMLLPICTSVHTMPCLSHCTSSSRPSLYFLQCPSLPCLQSASLLPLLPSTPFSSSNPFPFPPHFPPPLTFHPPCSSPPLFSFPCPSHLTHTHSVPTPPRPPSFFFPSLPQGVGTNMWLSDRQVASSC
ncbi:unnamed protein product [Closterium sp. Naga37s-1]|nr:unnamed protein product [Closterium sp. Naga37s-1]